MSKPNETSWLMCAGLVVLACCLPNASADCPDWSALGDGISEDVRALGIYNGELIAGGRINIPGDNGPTGVVKWDGTHWLELGSGVSGNSSEVEALTVYNGELIAGGWFTRAGRRTVNHVARWNGAAWSPVGGGTGDIVLAMTVYNGELIVGGRFTSAAGGPANHIARWDGARWTALGDGTTGNVHALTVYNGALIVGGSFAGAGGITVHRVARWDSRTWSALGSGTNVGANGQVSSLAVYNGELIVGGLFTAAGGMPAKNIARWDGKNWSPLGPGLGEGPRTTVVHALLPHGRELFAGGWFATAGGLAVNNIARWDGTNWSPLGSGVNDPRRAQVLALSVFDGGLIAGGQFPEAGGIPTQNIALWSCPFDRGDLNCDGQFNGADIDPFFLALGDPAAYAARFPDCNALNGDFNCDGRLGGGDIDPFFNCLAGNCADCNANGIPDYCEANVSLAITSQPENEIVCAAGTGILTVQTSPRALSFQWRKDGVEIPGATSNQLIFNSAQLSDSGRYDVIVADACVTLISDVARLAVQAPAEITQQPLSQTVCVSDLLILLVETTGTSLSYQWRKDGQIISGATGRRYLKPGATQADAGDYTVEVSNSCGPLISQPATVVVQQTIVSHPASQTVCETDPVIFTVGAVGGELTYQWRKNTGNIPGATSSFFVIAAAQLSDAGVYDVVVTSSQCTQVSDPARLTVRQCP